MNFVKRKITYRLYPNQAQLLGLTACLQMHCRVFNALLEEGQRRYQDAQQSFSFNAMCQVLTQWRQEDGLRETHPDDVAIRAPISLLNAQSLQVTAKRLALAFTAFFRRLKAGEAPGYPRFKSFQRYPGWGYKTYGDGWKLIQPDGKHGAVRIAGVGLVRMRGKGRFTGSPKTAEVMRKGDKWYLSVTYNVAEEAIRRPTGQRSMAFDWGVNTLLTMVEGDGTVKTIENPRWLKKRLTAIQQVNQALSAEEKRIREQHGLDAIQAIPVSLCTTRMRRLKDQIHRLHSKIARQRLDFYHKLTTKLVERYGLIATEALSINNMVKAPKAKVGPEDSSKYLPNGAAAKAGLNRAIQDGAPGMLLSMLRTKAEEAATRYEEAETRTLKPTQRCNRCGKVVKKTLSERQHVCTCGESCDRDVNAAKTLLRWALEGFCWPGTGQEMSCAA